MDWTAVRGCGHIGIERSTLPPGEGKIKMSEFLEGVVRGFARLSQDHWRYDKWELPFIYSERQLATVLLPTLRERAGRVLMEQPMRRTKLSGRTRSRRSRKDSGSGHGWVDYWADYRDLVLLMEVKHAWVSARTAGAAAYVVKRWQSCQRQMSTIDQQFMSEFPEFAGQPVWMVGLLVLVHRDGQADAGGRSREECRKVHQNVWEQLSTEKNRWPINWTALWHLPERVKIEWEKDEEPANHYPAVSFFASAHRVET
jgi:hypothetical protein